MRLSCYFFFLVFQSSLSRRTNYKIWFINTRTRSWSFIEGGIMPLDTLKTIHTTNVAELTTAHGETKINGTILTGCMTWGDSFRHLSIAIIFVTIAGLGKKKTSRWRSNWFINDYEEEEAIYDEQRIAERHFLFSFVQWKDKKANLIFHILSGYEVLWSIGIFKWRREKWSVDMNRW